MATAIQVTFDCADPEALAGFWCEALGYRADEPPAGHESWDSFLESIGEPVEHPAKAFACHDPEGVGPRLFFQRVPEGKAAKNRVHLDLRAAPGVTDSDERMARLEAECGRLVALGATRVERFEPGRGEAGFIVMRDPEGNEFCLD